MRLVLDEHIDPRVAEQLGKRGHDVVAVAESPGLRGRPDEFLFELAVAEERAIVTRDVPDFAVLAAQAISAGLACPCVIFVIGPAYPFGERGVGPLVRDLRRLLELYPARNALAGRAIWLSSIKTT